MKFNRSVKVLMASIVITASAIAITGCSDDNSSTTASKSVQSQSSTKNEKPRLLKAGETAVVDDYEVAILSAKEAKEYVNGPGEGNKYIVIHCRVKNVSKEEQDTNVSRNLQWLSADGTRRGYERSTGVKLMESKDKLAPGESGEFEEVYKVPKDKSDFEFHYATMKPDELARWQVTAK